MELNGKPNYLKYWKVVRNYIRGRYKLNTEDIDLLLFLRSERYFTKPTFRSYESMIGWEKNRMERLVNDGWLEKIRFNKKGVPDLFKISFKCDRVITQLYTMLDGNPIPESQESNPMFRGTKVQYSFRNTNRVIKGINKTIKQQRRLGAE